MNNKKLAVFGCKHTTLDLIEGLCRSGVKVDYCITLSPDLAKKEKVAGYFDLSSFLSTSQIPYYVVNKYKLDSDKDIDYITSLNIDIVLCMGWQRLLPEWLLKLLTIGAFGMHGSNKPLPHGRGRSPLNWSLIQNKTIFFTHLFKYDCGVDSGPIVDVQKFDITQWDNCHTLHLKNTIAMVKLCEKNIPNMLRGLNIDLHPQSDIGASFYPKRDADDGIIFWEDSTVDIFNLIRAVTRPFPGAFTFLNGKIKYKLIIWYAIPFDSRMEWNESNPGVILEVFYDKSFVVKTGDSTILVLRYNGSEISKNNIGDCLNSSDFKRKKWINLPS